MREPEQDVEDKDYDLLGFTTFHLVRLALPLPARTSEARVRGLLMTRKAMLARKGPIAACALEGLQFIVHSVDVDLQVISTRKL